MGYLSPKSLFINTFNNLMSMKKILLVLMAMFCIATVSAGNKVKQVFEAASTSRVSAGVRLGGSVEAFSELFYAKDVYVEGRLGYTWHDGVNFTAMHVWNPWDWNWTPRVCWWFFDAGVGAFVGGDRYHLHTGVAGVAKFGVLFKKVPIRLSVDYTPQLGVHIGYKKYYGATAFHHQWLNFGVSAAYCFRQK